MCYTIGGCEATWLVARKGHLQGLSQASADLLIGGAPQHLDLQGLQVRFGCLVQPHKADLHAVPQIYEVLWRMRVLVFCCCYLCHQQPKWILCGGMTTIQAWCAA